MTVKLLGAQFQPSCESLINKSAKIFMLASRHPTQSASTRESSSRRKAWTYFLLIQPNALTAASWQPNPRWFSYHRLPFLQRKRFNFSCRRQLLRASRLSAASGNLRFIFHWVGKLISNDARKNHSLPTLTTLLRRNLADGEVDGAVKKHFVAQSVVKEIVWSEVYRFPFRLRQSTHISQGMPF